MERRTFLQYLSLLGITSSGLLNCSKTMSGLYDIPVFGNASLLHFTDCHAQLLPVYYREPSVNLGVGGSYGKPPHLVGTEFLEYFGIKKSTARAHAFTYLDFTASAGMFGKMGGFAHLATLVKRLRKERGEENTLLLDGGDSWQGSATALWTRGQDMVDACNMLGVDVMTGHWEFTYGSERVLENLKKFKGQFVAQNIALSEEAQFKDDVESDAVFEPYTVRRLKNARIAIIGQAFPYTPIANPRRFIPDWQFGIQEQKLQHIVDEIRGNGIADAVVLLSHNGMDVDLKLASRISGIDFIMGGHTHDAIPEPVTVSNPGGKTRVTNAGSHGKFVGVLDMEIKSGRLVDFHYRLLPVFSGLLAPDAEMQHLVGLIRKPFLNRLQQPLAVTEELLYRRGNFYGTFDQLILDAQRMVNNAEIALSPGFRWGATLLPGQTVTYEDVMNLTAITYPETYTRILSGKELKTILEDVCDNLFNKDPYYQQGGDMVRVGGITYTCNPNAEFGHRIRELRRENGDRIEAGKRYKVSGWATVAQASEGKPVWDVVSEYLKDRKTVAFHGYHQPKLI